MLPRQACPDDLPADVNDCLYQCFEIHRRRVLQRRAERQAQQAGGYQQSFQTEQYQTVPSSSSASSARYSNLIEDSPRYQTLTEPSQITSEQRSYEYSSVDRPAETQYQSETIDTSERYHQLKEPQYTARETISSHGETIGQQQTSTEFTRYEDLQTVPVQTTSYSKENLNQYETAAASEAYSSNITGQQIIGSSVPTGTVEYTRRAYYSEEPISSHSKTTTYTDQIQSSDGRLADDIPQSTNIQTMTNDSLLTTVPSDHGGQDDAREDEELFDLRACICECYGKFKNSWNREQQEKYQRQFQDIPQPVQQITEQQYHEIQQPVSVPTHDYYQQQQTTNYDSFIPEPLPSYVPVLQPPIETRPPYCPPCPPCPPCPTMEVPPPAEYISLLSSVSSLSNN